MRIRRRSRCALGRARANVIKGRGGALFREKLVAAAPLVVVDGSNLVKELGSGVLPVEVLPHGSG